MTPDPSVHGRVRRLEADVEALQERVAALEEESGTVSGLLDRIEALENLTPGKLGVCHSRIPSHGKLNLACTKLAVARCAHCSTSRCAGHVHETDPGVLMCSMGCVK